MTGTLYLRWAIINILVSHPKFMSSNSATRWIKKFVDCSTLCSALLAFFSLQLTSISLFTLLLYSITSPQTSPHMRQFSFCVLRLIVISFLFMNLNLFVFQRLFLVFISVFLSVAVSGGGKLDHFRHVSEKSHKYLLAFIQESLKFLANWERTWDITRSHCPQISSQ